MGCVSSKKDINDLHPNIFQVMNVDQMGNRISHGELEITETELILYQRKKSPVKWPLRRLRRYGFEGELFSFESGRRCPTGPGIYAFHCLRAERLFNLVQLRISVDTPVEGDGGLGDLPALGPVVPIRVNLGPSNEAGNYLEPTPVNRSNIPNIRLTTTQNGMNIRRLGSVGSSNGPTSPQDMSSPSPPPISVSLLPPAPPPPVPIPIDEILEEAAAVAQQNTYEFNNNKPPSNQAYINTTESTESLDNASKVDDIEEAESPKEDNVAKPQPSYLNINIGGFPKSSVIASAPKTAIRRLSAGFGNNDDQNYARLEMGGGEPHLCHLYMNIGPHQKAMVVPRVDWSSDEARHCYANLEPSEIEIARSHLPNRLSGSERLPMMAANSPISPPGFTRQVNYIVLDLDQAKKDITVSDSASTPVSSVLPVSLALPFDGQAGKASESYATIDFNKTVALSHSVNPNAQNDSEGCRKTRHNSTINDIILPFD